VNVAHQVLSSSAIDNLLNYKYKKVQPTAFLYWLLYAGYGICLFHAPLRGCTEDEERGNLHPYILVPWIIIQIGFEVLEFNIMGLKFGKDLANIYDWTRIIMMILYTINRQRALFYCIIVITSGVTLLQFLNMFEKFRVYNEIYGASFHKIRHFIVILAVFAFSFSFGFYAYNYVANDAEGFESWT
jgi:hypothetical protein